MFNNISLFTKLRVLNNPFPKDTKNIKFTRWTINDVNKLFSLAQVEEIGLNSGWKPHKSINESKRVIEQSYSNIYTYALRLKETNELIGYSSLLPGSLSLLQVSRAEAEVGFWIGKKYWNKGYMSEALYSLIDYAFNKIHYKRIWGGCLEDNSTSEHLFLKNGFHYLRSIPVEVLYDTGDYKLEKVFYLTNNNQKDI